MPMQQQKILITGAGGFIGQTLASSLLSDPSVASITLTDISAPPVPEANEDSSPKKCNIQSLAADLTDPNTCTQLLDSDITHIYLLHGIMSGQAESNFDLGLRVNVDSMRYILDAIRQREAAASFPLTVVFPSSLAVFGPAKAGDVVTEKTMPEPQSSYGSEKAMVELMLNDFSRRGFVDARIVRLPIIIVRPGKPTGAASSFCSGIIREPLSGQTGVLPVKQDLRLWVCSGRTVIRNLLAAREIPAEKFSGGSRIVNLPGITVSVAEMLGALEKVGGKKALDLVKEEYDQNVARIVGSWPAQFDISKAKQLGFVNDVPLEQIVRDYIQDYLS